jgi:hypothetical protein
MKAVATGMVAVSDCADAVERLMQLPDKSVYASKAKAG